MTIKKRLVFSSIILLALFASMGVANWIGNNTVMDKSSLAYTLQYEMMHLQGLFRGINEFIIDEGEPLSIELTNKHLKGFDELHAKLMLEINDSDLKTVLTDTIDPRWQEVKKGSVAFLKNNPYISVEDDDAMRTYGKLLAKGKELLHEVEALADASNASAQDIAHKMKLTVNSLAGIILLIIAILLYSIFNAITRPLRELQDLAEGLHYGNLNVKIAVSKKDEFGILGNHFNNAIEKLNDMMKNVKNVVAVTISNSEKLDKSASKIASNSKEQSNKTTNTAASMEELSSSFIDVAKNTAAAAQSSKDASKLAIEGGQVVSETIEGMNDIASAVNDSAQTIEDLGVRSEQIGEIIKVIDDIASQTNLLALNAAIEAARAGEQGRGFAVVADEVRKLAERTTSATNEIGDTIKSIQSDTHRAVESMHGGRKKAESGVELANKAGDALQRIVESVQNVTDMAQQVAVAAEEQSVTGEDVSLNIESISVLTQQTSEQALNSSNATSEMSALVREILHLVEQFKLDDSNEQGMTNQQNSARGTHNKISDRHASAAS
jgi:methyl-accepting chemotaxis protein